MNRTDWKSPGVYEGQLLLSDPRPEQGNYLDYLDAKPQVRDYDTRFDFGVDVANAPWTAAMLLKDTVVPEDLTIAGGNQGEKPRVQDRSLKNAHIILSRCGLPTLVDAVLRHYNN